MELKVGQVWYDVDHVWTNGSHELDIVHVVLSADMEGGKYYWSTANFIWISDGIGFSGAYIRKFTEEEIMKMRYIGNLDSIWKTKRE